MPLIQGTVEYTTPRPFESASARVALSFAFVEGEDSNLQISKVAAMAEAHARHMISDPMMKLANVPGGAMSLAPGTVPGAPVAVEPSVLVAVKDNTAGTASGLPGAGMSPTVAAAQPAAAPPAPSPASNVVQLPGASMTTVLPTAETPTIGMASLPGGTPSIQAGGAPATLASPMTAAIAGSATVAPASAPVAGISDADLVAHITHRNAALIPVYAEGAAQKICDLVAEFVQPPAKAYAIPAAQRQSFLDRLAELK